MRSGRYSCFSASLLDRGSDGNYWVLRSFFETNSYNLDFNSSNLRPTRSEAHGRGFATYCVAFFHSRLRPSQRPIIVCEEWQLLLGLYGAYQQRFTRLLLVASFRHYYELQLPELQLIGLRPSEHQRSRKRVCGAFPRLRPPQRPIIVCEEWRLLLGFFA